MNKPEAYSYPWFIGQFQQAGDHAETFLLSLDDSTFQTKPSRDIWSVAECYSHLIRFGRLYMTAIQQRLHYYGIPDTVGTPTAFPPRIHWKWVIRWFEPPYTIKLKTLRPFEPQPTSGFSKEQVLQSFTDLQGQLVAQLREAESKGYNLDYIKTAHPLLHFIKMRLNEYYAVVDAHQRRHFWQAENIVKQLQAT